MTHQAITGGGHVSIHAERPPSTAVAAAACRSIGRRRGRRGDRSCRSRTIQCHHGGSSSNSAWRLHTYTLRKCMHGAPIPMDWWTRHVLFRSMSSLLTAAAAPRWAARPDRSMLERERERGKKVRETARRRVRYLHVQLQLHTSLS